MKIKLYFSYEDLLKRFLEFSLGDSRFSLLLLVAAYMNASLADALTLRCLLWSTATDVIRQMSVKVEEVVSLFLENYALFQQPLIDYVRKNLKETTQMLQSQFPDQMNVLFNAYDNAIKKGLVTANRNPALNLLASEQLRIVKANSV